MRAIERLPGLVVAAALLAGLVRASSAPVTAHRASAAVLRLAWSAVPERIEICREPGQDELARLPQHMRQPVVCEGTTAEYRLQVRLDGVPVKDRVVHGGGLRRDRRIYVFEEILVQPGEAALDIRLDRIDTGGPSAAKGEAPPMFPPATTRADERTAAVPPHLVLQQRVRFVAREAVLVTYAAERGALETVQRADRTPR